MATTLHAGSASNRRPVPSTALNRLLRPASVAIVGASATTGALGASVLKNLERAGYAGKIYLINPKRPDIDGRVCLPSVSDLPTGVDCAVLAIPRAGVMDALRECAARRVGGVIIYAVGFAEEGPQGRAQQEEIRRIAADAGMVVEGPNCLGLVNYIDGAALTFVETPARRAAGRAVAIISQSGAFAAMLTVSLHERDIPLSFTVSTGNEAVSGVEDYLDYMIAHDQTAVITIIAEQFRDPPRLLTLARRAAARGKALVLLHPGRSQAARASAATHTGAIAGDYAVMRTLVEQAGFAVADSLAEAMDLTELLFRCPRRFDAGLMLMTESGAFKALALDQCGALGVDLPKLSPANDAALRAAIPEFIPISNPLDLTAQPLVDPDIYRKALAAIMTDPVFGVLMFGIIMTDEATSQRKLPAIIEAIDTLRPSQPVIVAGLDEGANVPEALIDQLRRLGVPFFRSAERVFSALGRLRTRRTAVGLPVPAAPGVPPGELAFLTEFESKHRLKTLNLAMPRGGLARDVDEALEIAGDIGYPVVLKAQSVDLPHKSDAGGVILNLQDPAALRDGWKHLSNNLRHGAPDIVLAGVLVETMGRPGCELIIGAKRDPAWGPVLLAGFGGVMAELLQDTKLFAPGSSKPEIISDLSTLQAAKIFKGFRGGPPLDLESVAEVIIKLDDFMQAHPDIIEIDLNPVLVYPVGEGVCILDALILTAGCGPQ